MTSRPNYYPPERSITQLLNELKDELKEFVSTRVEMLRAEMKEKVSVINAALPAIAVGAVFALLAVLLLSVCLVALVAMAFGGGAGAWAIAFGIVGGVFLIIGGGAIGFGISKIRSRSLAPERTLRVLKQDQAWFQSEARREL